jgi:phosphoesterase RecJ-like protein
MLVTLADALHAPLTGEIARCLLTGLVTDTLGFRTSNTSADVLEAAMRLMRAGADLAAITEQTLNRRPFSAIRLWGLALPAVQLDERVIWTTISRSQTAAARHDGSDLQLSSWLVTANEADISAVFTEKVDEGGQLQVECSFRAKPGFDVSQLAYALGGGGHPPASGCTLPGDLDAVTSQVLPLLKQAQRQARHAHG